MQRRLFLKTSSIALAGAGGIQHTHTQCKKGLGKDRGNITLALNAYSFNKPLLDGRMSLEELFRLARKTGFAGVDLTAYYIQGYPEVPEDKVLFKIKKMAFRLGLAISGTGVRNNFALSNPIEHADNIDLVKQWIVAASKLGAPHVRVFAGRGSDADNSRKTVKAQVIEAFQECADFGSHHGVMVVFQNHFDYIKSTQEVVEILDAVQSEWFGLMLDIGSIPGPDPYPDIEKLIPYAASWQVKEQMKSGNGTVPTDFGRLMKIVHDQQYHGYFPLETLGEGDPEKKVEALYQEVIQTFQQ
ncbi:MAG: sugar phosphate isomerase/epimerase family protein [Bacteroidota bacterium]